MNVPQNCAKDLPFRTWETFGIQGGVSRKFIEFTFPCHTILGESSQQGLSLLFLLIITVLLTVFPDIVLFLPRMMVS